MLENEVRLSRRLAICKYWQNASPVDRMVLSKEESKSNKVCQISQGEYPSYFSFVLRIYCLNGANELIISVIMLTIIIFTGNWTGQKTYRERSQVRRTRSRI